MVVFRKFMEDCIHANPTPFLGEKLTIVGRQERLQGFIPDLIAENDEGEVVIIEIQQYALDRYHLYKSLEYRDLISEKYKVSVRILLVCETMNKRFENLLKTHFIKLIKINRIDFIPLAIRETPEIVTKHLLVEGQISTEVSKADRKIEFYPFNWMSKTNVTEIFRHLYNELGRLKVNIDGLHRSCYEQVHWDVCNLLDEELERALAKIWLPSAWNYERLAIPVEGRKPGVTDTLRKPQIYISLYLTKKGNLSVVWWPTEFHGNDSESDWIRWPGEHAAGWDRPNNELFFVRGVSHLHP